jgi:hypothetical protein
LLGATTSTERLADYIAKIRRVGRVGNVDRVGQVDIAAPFTGPNH